MKPITRLFMLGFIISVLLMGIAHASRQALEFSDVDVKVGSKTSKNLRNGETIDDEAEPGDAVEFRVELRNNYTSAEDLKIEDITVTVTIEGIDDGDDLEEDSKEFDLRPNSDKRVSLDFRVPIEVEEDSYDVTITAEGDDENGTSQDISMRLKLEVEKENHLLKITRASLSPAELSCSRKNVQAAMTVLNIGNEDEEDIEVQILSPDLEVDLSQNVAELTAEPHEDESRYSNIFTFSIPSDAEAGSYPVTFRALYDENRKKAEETATLTISDCATAKPVEETSEESEDVEVISPTTGRTTTTIVEPSGDEGVTVTQESFLRSNAFITGIIIAEVIAVIVGIVLVVALFRRRS
ncbi:hypothetical protein HYV80_00420 [Candidatus Woesearchaeota archaeon]|nr:hypothetical protein [Candidatus Woesearchaeota archaeon]